MSIYINKDTKVITQGITGKTGQFLSSRSGNRFCRLYLFTLIATPNENLGKSDHTSALGCGGTNPMPGLIQVCRLVTGG